MAVKTERELAAQIRNLSYSP